MDASLWCATLLEPVDQGPAKDPAAESTVRGRKLRPIMLCEALVKLAETVAIDGVILHIRRSLEPHQLGVNTPDGVVMAVRVLRGWADDIEQGAASTQSTDVLVGTDLANAYCRMLRSGGLRSTRSRAPALARMLAMQWGHGGTAVWQRIGGRGWAMDWALRGGAQGSNLARAVFALDLADALDEAFGPAPTVARVSFADDGYLAGPAAEVEEAWPALEEALGRHGHHLRRHKCACWFPALDAKPQAELSVPEDAAVRSLAALVPRVVGGLPALGSAAQGRFATILGPPALAAAPAAERAAGAAACARRLAEMARRRADPLAAQCAWTILSKSVAHALDYDARMCPAGALSQAFGMVQQAVRDAAQAIIGKAVDDDAWAQLQLPGALGGCSLRVASGSYAEAAYWAGWAAHREEVSTLAAQLGRPHEGTVDAEHGASAAGALEAAGVVVSGPTLALAPALEAELSLGPWSSDRPTGRIFEFDGELPGAPVGETAPQEPVLVDRSAVTPAQPPGDEGKRRRILGRILRALDTRDATALWHRIGPHRRRCLLAAGGPGAGLLWSAIPVADAVTLNNARWVTAMQMRLGLLRAPPGAVCLLPRGREPGEVCGAVLDACCEHPTVCDVGPVRMRTHKALARVLRRELLADGASVDLERPIPELAATDEAGTIQDAVLDLCVHWPGSPAQLLLDVSVRSQHATRYGASASRPGAAAASGEGDKERRYGLNVLPLVFEAAGRLGVGSRASLEALLAESRAWGRPRRGGRQGLDGRRLRLHLEAAVLREEADAILLALGCRARAILGWAAAPAPEPAPPGG